MKTAGMIFMVVIGCLGPACSDGGHVTLDEQTLRDFDIGKCPRAGRNVQKVAIDDLVGNPGSFEGKPVEISGYYYNYFEHSAIYATPEAKPYQHDFREGVWVTGVPLDYPNGSVKLVGVFTEQIRGHLGQWAGAICARSIVESVRKHD